MACDNNVSALYRYRFRDIRVYVTSGDIEKSFTSTPQYHSVH